MAHNKHKVVRLNGDGTCFARSTEIHITNRGRKKFRPLRLMRIRTRHPLSGKPALSISAMEHYGFNSEQIKEVYPHYAA